MRTIGVKEDTGLIDPRVTEKHEVHLILEMAALTLLTIFVETMLVPGLPIISEDLRAGPSDLAWILTAYTLAGAITIPIVGKLGEMWGSKRILLALMVVYIISIIGAALAWDLVSLLAFRALQGVGMGAMPLLMGMTKDALPARKVPLGLGIISSMIGVGAASGLVVGGLLMSLFGWNGAFWVVLPIAIITTAIVNNSVPDLQVRQRTRMDAPGAILLGSALLSFLLVLSRGSEWGWGSTSSTVLMICAAISFVAFIVREGRFSEPIMRFELMRNRNILMAYASILFFGMIMFMLYQTLPYFIGMPTGEGGFGISNQVVIGLFLLPNAVMQMIFSTVGAKIGQRIGHWRVLVIGMAIVAVSLIALALVRSSELGTLAALAVFGIGMGSATVGNTNMLSTSCSKEEFGSATAVNAMILTIGMSIGPVLAGLIVDWETDLSMGYAYCWVAAALIALFTATFVLLNKGELERVGGTLCEMNERASEGAD